MCENLPCSSRLKKKNLQKLDKVLRKTKYNKNKQLQRIEKKNVNLFCNSVFQKIKKNNVIGIQMFLKAFL